MLDWRLFYSKFSAIFSSLYGKETNKNLHQSKVHLTLLWFCPCVQIGKPRLALKTSVLGIALFAGKR